MTQIVKFPVDFYDAGVVKFVAGEYYPLNSETQSLVGTGFAEMIEEDNSVDHAAVLQAHARIAQQRAQAAMAQAMELAAEYEVAQSLADAVATPVEPADPTDPTEPTEPTEPAA